MKNIEYTCETRIIPGREGESVKAIRLNNTETLLHHVTQGKEYGSPIMYTEHFMTGPVADKLYAYENLGYSPEELKMMINKHMLQKQVANSIFGSYGTLVAAVSVPKISREKVEEAVKNYVDTDSIRAKQMEAYIRADLTATEPLYNEWVKRNIFKNSQFDIKKVIFNDPATIVIWADGTKTVVKATNEAYDPEKGLAMAISKRALGDEGNYYEVFKKHLKKCPKKENSDVEG